MTPTRAVASALAAITLVGVASYSAVRLIGRRPAPPQAAPSSTDDEGSPPTLTRLVHWNVQYTDARFGVVRGRATVDWANGRATLRFPRPDGAVVVQSADDVTVSDDGTAVTLRLRGGAVGDERVSPPDTAGMPALAAAAGQALTVTPSRHDFSAPVIEKAPVDHDGARLTLHPVAFGGLIGEWSYLADPLTQQNASGAGRVGSYRLLNASELPDKSVGFLGEQRGGEDWSPLPAEIHAVALLQNQLATRNTLAAYPYPRGEAGPFPDDAHSRLLFVVGRDLPVDGSKVIQGIRFDETAGIKAYTVVGLSTDPALDDKTRALFDDGWKIVGAQLTAPALERARRTLDAALVRVAFDAGVLPGPKTFTWEEGEASWFLQFGDDSAQAAFVRPVTVANASDSTSADTFENTTAVFLPEQIAVELRVRAPLPLKEIPVHVATMAAPDAPVAMTARLTNVAGVYRTALFDIGPGGHAPLALKSGDRLMATVQAGDVAFIAPPLASADVRLTPDELTTARKAGDSTQLRLWKDALAVAARADGKTLTDFSSIAGQSLDAYHGIRMTVGAHAAMLLMRSDFLELMRQRVAWLDSVKSDDDVEAFREWLRPFLDVGTPPPPEREVPIGWDRYPWFPAKAINDVRKLKDWFLSLPVEGARLAIRSALTALDSRPESGFGKGTYFGELRVPGPGGGTWPYFRTYWDDRDTAFEPFFHGSRIALRDWRLQATRAVLKQYRDAAQASIDSAAAIRDDDRVALLKLTSLGFAPVAASLVPTLMRLDEANGRQRWVPDREARAAVTNLFVFGEAVRAAEDYSDLVRNSAIEVFASALAWNAPALFLEEGSAAALTTYANHGLIAWQVGGEIYDHFVTAQQMDTFFGASVVLGADRLEEAHARYSSIAEVVGNLALQFRIGDIEGELWNALEHTTGPSSGKATAPLAWLETPLDAAGDPPPARRVRSLKRRVLDALGRMAEAPALKRIQKLQVADLKAWPRQPLQWFLQKARTGGERIDEGKPVRREDVAAAAEARRLGAGAYPALMPGEPPAAADPPKVDAAGLLEAAPEPEPPLAGPYIASMARYREDVAQFATPGWEMEPADKTWIAIRENGEWVKFKTTHLNEKGLPNRLGSGAASEVYAVVDVDNFPRLALEGDGVVLKIVHDSKDFGAAREQIARMQEAYKTLKAAAARDPLLEFPEIEFHPNAEPPYLVQRRVPANRADIEMIKPRSLFNDEGELLPWRIIDEKFPLPLREAVVDFYARLAKAGLVAPDMSLGNLYFQKIGGRWVAKPLDIDHIVPFKGPETPASHRTWQWLRGMNEGTEFLGPASSAVDQRKMRSSPETCMEKLLEMPMAGNGNRGYLGFVTDKKGKARFYRSLIEPDLVAKYFPQFRRRFEPKTHSLLQRLLPLFQWPAMVPAPVVG